MHLLEAKQACFLIMQSCMSSGVVAISSQTINCWLHGFLHGFVLTFASISDLTENLTLSTISGENLTAAAAGHSGTQILEPMQAFSLILHYSLAGLSAA